MHFDQLALAMDPIAAASPLTKKPPADGQGRKKRHVREAPWGYFFSLQVLMPNRL